MTHDTLDPKGLIREAYAIDGITAGECRSIFLDADHQALIGGLLARYGLAGHPMTDTLTSGLGSSAPAKRRGGRSGRVIS
jgi:hypothetical protein